MTCKKHPKYEAKMAPRRTTLFPKGCPDCWEMYEYACGSYPSPQARADFHLAFNREEAALRQDEPA